MTIEQDRTTIGRTNTETAAEVSKKSCLVLTLLALVLGQFGAHRFYLRKTGTALVMFALAIFAYAVLIHSSSVPRVVRPYPNGHFETVPEYSFSIYYHLGLVWIWTLLDIITAARGKFQDRYGKPVSRW